jgi:hypothetical protein
MARVVWVGPSRDWPSLGFALVDWLERFLVHGPGDVQGDPLELDDELAQFIIDCYRVHPRRSRRPGRRAVSLAELSRAKGRAKSELAGALVCAEFCGPVRFDHWATAGEVSSWGYEYEPGEPVGRLVTYPFIRPLATEEGQTGNTYGNVDVMLRHAAEHHSDHELRLATGATLRPFARLDIGDTRIYRGRKSDGEIRPSTASSKSKDGGKESFAVADETHLYTLPELREMYAVVRRNTGKRSAAEPWMLSTTTSYEPGAGSVAQKTAEQAELVLAGKKRTPPGFLYDHREATGPDDWLDDKQLMDAVRDAYGPFGDVIDVERLVTETVRDALATEQDGRRYWLNQRGKGAASAIDLAVWDELAAPERTPGPGRRIVVGFDGSEGGDRADDTVLVGWTVEEVPHLFLIDRWRRPDRAGKEWKVARGPVAARVEELRTTMTVARFVADPPYWRETLEHWARDFGGDDTGEEVVEEFATNSAARMGPAVDMFLELVDRRAFTHDGSPELREYAGNVHLAKAAGRSRFRAFVKPAGEQSRKIDGIVAAALSLPSVVRLAGSGPAVDLAANVH